MLKQCEQCAGSGEFPIIGSQCTGCFGSSFVEVEMSFEEKIEQLISDLEEHADQLLATADRLKTTYSEDIVWYRIIESLEILRDKWIPKAISDARELEKIAEENYKEETED